MFGRDEKVSAIRLTAAQYMILGNFPCAGLRIVAAAGDAERSTTSLAAEKNQHSQCAGSRAPRKNSRPRRAHIVDNYPSFSALLLRDSSRDLNADADLIAEGLHLDPNEVRTRIRHFASMPQYQPIFLKEDITPDEQAFIEAHRNELPELDTIRAAPAFVSAQRIHGAFDRLRGRSHAKTCSTSRSSNSIIPAMSWEFPA